MNESKPKTPVDLEIKPTSYQPTKAEKEEEIDMPGWSMDRVRDTFSGLSTSGIRSDLARDCDRGI